VFLKGQLAEYIPTCFAGLPVQSHEHQDAPFEIAQMSHDEDWRLAVWEIAQGLQTPAIAKMPLHAGLIHDPGFRGYSEYRGLVL
jgi:hypothetical protein